MNGTKYFLWALVWGMFGAISYVGFTLKLGDMKELHLLIHLVLILGLFFNVIFWMEV